MSTEKLQLELIGTPWGKKKYLYITTYLLFKGALVFSKERGRISPKGFKLIDLLLAMATDYLLTNLWPVCI